MGKGRLASYAKKHLEISRGYESKLPESVNRALLIGVWCEYFLNLLEECNFNIFDPNLHSPSYVKVPMAMNKAAKNGTY